MKSVVCVSPVFTTDASVSCISRSSSAARWSAASRLRLAYWHPRDLEQGGSVRIPRKCCHHKLMRSLWGISGYRKYAGDPTRKSASLVLKLPTEHSGTNPDPFCTTWEESVSVVHHAWAISARICKRSICCKLMYSHFCMSLYNLHPCFFLQLFRGRMQGWIQAANYPPI